LSKRAVKFEEEVKASGKKLVTKCQERKGKRMAKWKKW